uniref:Uncharacterized protein n=1 Tax=Ditylenchus dipsaci TaxID=166011 RepID=A0A915CZ07_9BILA
MIAVYLLEVQPFEWVVKADGLKISRRHQFPYSSVEYLEVYGDLDIENVFCLEIELPWKPRSSPPLLSGSGAQNGLCGQAIRASSRLGQQLLKLQCQSSVPQSLICGCGSECST